MLKIKIWVRYALCLTNQIVRNAIDFKINNYNKYDNLWGLMDFAQG